MNKTNFGNQRIFYYNTPTDNQLGKNDHTLQQTQINLPPAKPQNTIHSHHAHERTRTNMINRRCIKQQPLENYINKNLNISLDNIIKLIKSKHAVNIPYFNGLQLLQDHFGNEIPEGYYNTYKELTEKNYISYYKFLELLEVILEYETNTFLRNLSIAK